MNLRTSGDCIDSEFKHANAKSILNHDASRLKAKTSSVEYKESGPCPTLKSRPLRTILSLLQETPVPAERLCSKNAAIL
jgi:hypothetical protein